MKKEKTSEKKKPTQKFRSGKVTATIWEQDQVSKDGRPFKSYNITIEKSYTKDEGKTWESTSSFFQDELQRVIIVATEAQKFLLLNEE